MSSWIRVGFRLAGLALFLGGFLLAVSLAKAGFESPGSLSAFAAGPSNVSGWKEGLEGRGYAVAATIDGPLVLAGVADPGRTVWVALGLERRYSLDELAAVDSFLDAGGNLLLADARGHGNLIAGSFPVRFGPSRILDERFEGNGSFVLADADLALGSYRLALNNPVGLLVEDEFAGDVLVQSSNRSFFDINDNTEVDEADVPGPFPIVATWKSPADGRIVVSGDLGLFLNQALNKETNDHAAFQDALARLMLPNGGTFLLDESLHTQAAAVERLGSGHRDLAHLAGNAWVAWVVAGAGAMVLLLPFVGVSAKRWTRHEPAYRVEHLPHKPDQVSRAVRDAALRTLSHATGLSGEQLGSLPPSELASITQDEILRQAILTDSPLSTAQIERLLTDLERQSVPR